MQVTFVVWPIEPEIEVHCWLGYITNLLLWTIYAISITLPWVHKGV